VPPAGTRIFYIGLNGSIKCGILWGYDTKAAKLEKTVLYKDRLPIVNQSVFEAVKDAGEYYLYPAYTLLAKIIPDIMFKVNDKTLKLKKDDEDFTDKTFKRIFRLLKRRKLSFRRSL
jgi:hypothetical protein